MKKGDENLVCDSKVYSFIQSVISDTPTIGQHIEIVQPSSVEISDVVDGFIDDAIINKALKENKPPFNLWKLSQTKFKYDIEEGLRKGKYLLAETYSYDRKKATRAWPATIVISALIIKALVSIEPSFDLFDFESKNVEPTTFYKAPLWNMFNSPRTLFNLGITKDLNNNFYFLMFDYNFKNPSSPYAQYKIPFRPEEISSDRIKRMEKQKSIMLLNEIIEVKKEDYSKTNKAGKGNF